MSKLLYPPFNFSSVENQLYRSAFFNELNIKYLESLRLKTVIALEDVIHPSMQSFCIENHVNLISVSILYNITKEIYSLSNMNICLV